MQAKKLIEAIRNAGYEPRSYSGRGMYGRSCVGVTVERGTSAFTVGIHVAEQLGENAYEAARLDTAQDSLGLDTILYFPMLDWPKDVPDSDEDDDLDDEDDFNDDD